MDTHLPDWLRRLLCRFFGVACVDCGDFRVRLEFVSKNVWDCFSSGHLHIVNGVLSMSASLTLSLDDTGAHSAVLTCVNTQDGSTATGVTITYAGDNDAVATIAPDSGALRLVGVGTVNLTGSGVRGAFSHSDTGVLTVTAGDPNKGDFSATLGLN